MIQDVTDHETWPRGDYLCREGCPYDPLHPDGKCDCACHEKARAGVIHPLK